METVMRKRERLRFKYVQRDPDALAARYGWPPAPPRKAKPLTGTDTLLLHLHWIEASRRGLADREAALAAFLAARPTLQHEYRSFLAAGGGDDAALKLWMTNAAEREGVIRRKAHLALVWSADKRKRKRERVRVHSNDDAAA
jgi:hypothetical protein